MFTTFINISAFDLHNYLPHVKWMFISSYANALGHSVCFTLLLNPSRVSSFQCSFHHFLVHFIISLCASFEADLLHSLGTLTLTNIDHVSIMKSVSLPHLKEVENLAKVARTSQRIWGVKPCKDTYIFSIVSKTRRYKETHTRHVGQCHLMRVT